LAHDRGAYFHHIGPCTRGDALARSAQLATAATRRGRRRLVIGTYHPHVKRLVRQQGLDFQQELVRALRFSHKLLSLLCTVGKLCLCFREDCRRTDPDAKTRCQYYYAQ
jgi:hypothetical protein